MSFMRNCFARFSARHKKVETTTLRETTRKRDIQNSKTGAAPSTQDTVTEKNKLIKSGDQGRSLHTAGISEELNSCSESSQTLNEPVARTSTHDNVHAELDQEIHPVLDAERQTEIIEEPLERANLSHAETERPQFAYKLDQGTKIDLELAEPRRPSLIHRSTSNISLGKQDEYNSNKHWLMERLEAARIESPGNQHSFFVPRSAQEKLITVSNVARDILARNPNMGDIMVAGYAKKTCEHARRLYAILAYVKRGADICKLLDECVTDQDLPLRRQSNDKSKFALHRQQSQEGNSISPILHPILTMADWSHKSLEKFDRVQWWMNAPVFVSGMRHVFDSGTILPFVGCQTQQKKEGGYSKVYVRQIHHAHHNFSSDTEDESEPLFAVKELFSSEKSEFLKEATILEALRPKNHPHLIKLLATYQKDETYHLIFPYASANLRDYWDDHHAPSFDRNTVLWVLRQMTGIASGIVQIHEFRVTQPLLVAGAGNSDFRNPGDVRLSVKVNEQYYGRHGDIKPENILWFDKDPTYKHVMGVLQIADFGLGRFHGRESRSGVSRNVLSSPIYEPPECKLSLPVSRSYDMWSLGCLYLEFITWILKGSLEIGCFSDSRGRVPTGGFVDDYSFYTITNIDGYKDAVIRQGVKDWVAKLHADEHCSELIHDLLDLIMEMLIVVDPEARSQAPVLHNQLKDYLRKSVKDDDYLLKPCPVPLLVPEIATRTSLERLRKRSKRTSVTFVDDREKPLRPKIDAHSESDPIFNPLSDNDIVVRIEASPTTVNKIPQSRTWPR